MSETSDQFQEEYKQAREKEKSDVFKGRLWRWGLILVAVILLMGSCSSYNSLNSAREDTRQEFSNIDTLLQRRNDLIPNQVKVIQGYVGHEQKYAEIFAAIATAQAASVSARSTSEKIAADGLLTAALGRMVVVTQQIPALKADSQFQALTTQLEGTENRIQVGRRDYNLKATRYNTKIGAFPSVLFASIFRFEREELFKADAGARQVPQVQF